MKDASTFFVNVVSSDLSILLFYQDNKATRGMPPLSLPSAVMTTVIESGIAGAILPELTTRSTANTSQVYEVICAWPVSGQYGPGSRIL